MNNNKAIILLSGGLDSVVALSETINNYNIQFAITFDYGQKAAKQELKSSIEIAQHFCIKHINIKLDWYEKLINQEETDWIPNRNGVFINIAGAFAEKHNIDNIIIGINHEEGLDFKDNTQNFLSAINNELQHSTQNEVKAVAPLIKLDKEGIVNLGIKNNIPFEKIYSCYEGEVKHCGECTSCKFLKKALIKSNREDLVNKLFKLETKV